MAEAVAIQKRDARKSFILKVVGRVAMTFFSQLDNLDVKVDPDPIVVKTGEKVGLHFAIDLLKEVKGGTVKIDIKSGLLPVPCLEIEGHRIGSCEYQTAELVGAFCQLCTAIGNCEELLPPGQACGLPAAPGHYGGVFGGDDMVYVDIPEIPSIILNFLNGKIKAHILGKDEAGNEDLCADLEIDLVVP
jgi:hypothetical protein